MLIACLEEVKNLYSDGRSDEKKKAQKAGDILHSIYNIKFTLTLAVLCDVYEIYSQIAVLLQVQYFCCDLDLNILISESLRSATQPLGPVQGTS